MSDRFIDYSSSEDDSVDDNSRLVTFGELTIVEFNTTLGDNPACSAGAPVQLGDVVISKTSRNLELYEHFRASERRQRKQLVLSVPKRAALLMGAGFSMNEIAQATMNVDAIKKQRRDSMSTSGAGWDKVKSVLESTGKLPKGIMNGFKNVLINPGNKPKQPTARSA